jgi:hypothetical protein
MRIMMMTFVKMIVSIIIVVKVLADMIVTLLEDAATTGEEVEEEDYLAVETLKKTSPTHLH